MEIEQLKLPTERSEPRTALQDYSMLWYGREKIGKTSMLAEFPDALVFLFEPGGKALSLYECRPMDWLEFKRYSRLLAKSKRFRTIGIDTVDIAYKMCYTHMCQKMGADHPKEDSWTIWTMIKDEFMKEMTLIQQLGRGVIFTSHETEKEIKVRIGESTSRIIPSMSKQARDVLEPMIDIWCYFRYTRGGEREILIRGNEHISAGHRLQKNFVGIERISMGKTAKAGYESFLKAFQQTAEVKTEEVIRPKVKIKIGGV